MLKLNFQDASFLRAETPERPFHVGALLICARPKNAPANYMRRLATTIIPGLLDSSPIFRRKLKDPYDLRNPAWIEDVELDLDFHFRHYALPHSGSMDDLRQLVALAHQPLLDRGQPLWEYHLIDGLPRGRFAIYSKIHHALVDGVAGIGLMSKQLQSAPMSLRQLANAHGQDSPRDAQKKPHNSWLNQLERNFGSLLDQSRTLPEVVSQVMQMGRSNEGADGSPPLPFTAPATILNQEGGARRELISLNLSLDKLRAIGRSADGTINDALVALFGGAVRAYLQDQGKVPRGSLVAALPVSVQSAGGKGNSLSMTLCPLGTNIADPGKRLQRIVKVTRNVKKSMSTMSPTGLQNMMNLIMMPVMALSAAHMSAKVRPVANVVLSNVPGPKATQYLADSTLEAIYPISLLTEAVALNFTAISYRKQVCIGLMACPDKLSDIGSLHGYIQQSFEELLATV